MTRVCLCLTSHAMSRELRCSFTPIGKAQTINGSIYPLWSGSSVSVRRTGPAPSWVVNLLMKTCLPKKWRNSPTGTCVTSLAAIPPARSPNASQWTRDRATIANWSGATRRSFASGKCKYYDRKDAHLKTLTLGSYEQYLDRYWRAGEMTMVNHLTGKSTVLSWTDFQFRTNLDDRDFTQTGLRRVR